MHSITSSKWFKNILAGAFWIILWALIAKSIGYELLIASPLVVVKTLVLMLQDGLVWRSIFNSCIKIAMGFFLSLILGTLLAILCKRFTIMDFLFSPIMRLIRATPVASIVIVVLIWVSSSHLSIVISFMMACPIIFENVSKGIEMTDIKLLEMAKLFRFKKLDTIKAIYFPQVLPYLVSAVNLSLGLCWKSGVAAEIIGLPNASIGENLYQAKVFFDTPTVFAWTLIIITLSFIFEHLFAYLIKKGTEKWKV